MSEISNSIEMKAPPQKVFEVVSDLAAWPRYLPHYRWIRFMESHRDYHTVRMACYRGWIPIDWVSRYHADPKTRQLHFEHLKAFTRGMKVTWYLEPIQEGQATQVTIKHDLEPVAQRLGRFVAERIIGKFFIDFVATRTLRNFARNFSGETTKQKTI